MSSSVVRNRVRTVTEAADQHRPLLVGLTGGIGSGKTTVARMLAGKGAVVVDADALARQVLEPGQPALEEVRQVFGPEVLQHDGSLDRRALARLVFANADARKRLEAITLPRVSQEARRLMAQAGPGQVAVYDVPLLVEKHLEDQFDLVLVVEADLEQRLRRLAARGLSREESVARMGSQASDVQRRAVSDVVLRNSAGLEQLGLQVDRLWQQVTGTGGAEQAQRVPRPR